MGVQGHTTCGMSKRRGNRKPHATSHRDLRLLGNFVFVRFGDIFRIGLKSSIWFDLMYSSVPYLHAHQGDWRVAPYLMPEHLLRQWPPTYIGRAASLERTPA
eukprot:GHVS01027169.1.p1 GENE.GHVS01027169.1~~GHVS01027169.1.p1  ORF type:complete len:102 (+),score=3.99 GHVS01027169.1:250-555(+)